MMNFVLGIAGALITALLVGVGKMLWSLTGDVRELRLTVGVIAKEVEELKRLVEGGRKWRWDRTPPPEPGKE